MTTATPAGREMLLPAWLAEKYSPVLHDLMHPSTPGAHAAHPLAVPPVPLLAPDATWQAMNAAVEYCRSGIAVDF